MKIKKCKSLSAVVLAAAAVFTTSNVFANLLTDPGFEPPATLGGWLPPIADQWLAENAALSGVNSGVDPRNGIQMLQINPTSLIASQVAQQIEGPFTAGTVFTFEAWFNAPVGGTLGGVSFSGRDALSGAIVGGTFATGSITIDADPATWELISISGSLLADSAVIEAQVYYRNDTIVNTLGFVDDADLRIVPLPPALILLISGFTALLAMGRVSASRKG